MPTVCSVSDLYGWVIWYQFLWSEGSMAANPHVLLRLLLLSCYSFITVLLLPMAQPTQHLFWGSGMSFPRHTCHLVLAVTQTLYKYLTDIWKWSLNLWLFAVVIASLLLQEVHALASLHTWCLHSLLEREQRTLSLIEQLPSLFSWKLVLVINTSPSVAAPGSSTQIHRQPKAYMASQSVHGNHTLELAHPFIRLQVCHCVEAKTDFVDEVRTHEFYFNKNTASFYIY